MKRGVLVRILVPVTYGSQPTWQVGDVVSVTPALARVMVQTGEAVYQTGLDSTVALPNMVQRVRHA